MDVEIDIASTRGRIALLETGVARAQSYNIVHKYYCTNISAQIWQGNALFSGKTYTAGTNSTQTPVATVKMNNKKHCIDAGMCKMVKS